MSGICSDQLGPRIVKSGGNRRVCVVGAGVGGLAVASRIAARSRENGSSIEVVVVEKNSRDKSGGRCGSFDVNIPGLGTFRHERGPSLLLLKNVYEDLFRDCGNYDALNFELEIEQCIPAYQVVFDDGDSIELGFPSKDCLENEKVAKCETRSRAKMNQFESNGAQKWDEYMGATSAFLDCGLPNFIEERLDIPSFPAFLREALRGGGKAWPLKPHSDVLDAIFDSNKMKAMASFQDLYVGLEPYKKRDSQLDGGVITTTAPAVFGLLAALELHPTNEKCGVHAPIGGFRAVGNAFEQLAIANGVKIQYETTVTQVTNTGVNVLATSASNDNGNISGADTIPADIIVINADLPYATTCLLDGTSNENDDDTVLSTSLDDRFDWDDTFRFSSGVIAFHWSVKQKLNSLNTHNVFLVAGNRDAAEKSWEVLRSNSSSNSEERSFNFYVHRASETDSTAAPEGCDAIMVLVPCKTLLRDDLCATLPRDEAMKLYKDQFDDEMVGSVREIVLQRLSVLDGLHDLRKHIVHEVVDTPGTYAGLYNLAAGTPFALSHGFGQLSLTRPSAECKEFGNVLFVGASSRPGNGVPLVLLGAKSVASKVEKKLSILEEAEQTIQQQQ